MDLIKKGAGAYMGVVNVIIRTDIEDAQASLAPELNCLTALRSQDHCMHVHFSFS